MKFSENWLREWVDPPLSIDDLAAQLTMAGLEVGSVEPAATGLADLVIGEVLSVEPHPDADKLKVCQVAAGQGEPLQVVCGAPNVRVGMKSPLAPVGANLPGDINIKKSKLRGVESHGMLCSARELGLSENHQGLMELPADAEPGRSLQGYLGLDDALIEIDLTPNRGDCLGIAGIAREVGTLTQTPVIEIEIEDCPETIADEFAVQVQVPASCPRYLGRVIRGIDSSATTPLWMQERLRRSGIRSLGPLVDVTNYVLLELGQPMHAFDLAKLSGGIVVRNASDGEQLVLLDDTTVHLDADTLVIADHDKPLAIAGVMGGIDSGIGSDTSDLFLECAFFAPEAIAGCARKYAMQTESAHRFERGVDPQCQHRAMQRASSLLLDIVGGKAGPISETVSKQHLPVRTTITLRKARIARVLGLLPEPEIVSDILTRLGMKTEYTGESWVVTPPSFRFDIAIEADLIEEIGRVYGYERLPSEALTGALQIKAIPETHVSMQHISATLIARGYQEIITYSFVDPDLQGLLEPHRQAVKLANPLSTEMADMRTGLWPGLLKALQYNLHRQKTRLRFFECGLRFYLYQDEIKQENVISGVIAGSRAPEHWDSQVTSVDYFDLKCDVEAILALSGRPDLFTFTAAEQTALHPGQSARIICAEQPAGWIGRIHPALAKQLDIDPATCLFELEYSAIDTSRLAQFSPISRYPTIRRDLAVVVAAGVCAADLQAEVRAAAGEILRELIIFDVYQGKGIETGRKSIAFGLILQDSSRTLMDEEVEAVVGRVTARLGEKFGASLRD